MEEHTSRQLFVGLDVHKSHIDVVVAEDGPSGEIRYFGRVGGEVQRFDKVLRQLARNGRTLRFVYEAGPCGYVLYRYLKKAGYSCLVVSPTHIPKRSGDRVKTDRRDAEALARLLRAGELSGIYVPNDEDEALRDLWRTREQAKYKESDAKRTLKMFLLRHGIAYRNNTAWTDAHMRTLAQNSLPHTAQQVAFQEYVTSVNEETARVRRCEELLADLASESRLWPLIQAYQALRGVALVTAIGLATELGDLRRFDSPRKTMGFVGLVPSEYSSGLKIRKGAITRTGNSRARYLCVEAAWAYRHKPAVLRALRVRQEGLPQQIVDISWQAQLRLTKRYRRLISAGKPAQKAVVAVAREFVGFVWAIAQHVDLAQPQMQERVM